MYSQDSKDKALGMLRLTGDVEKTARMSGVPGRTLRRWAAAAAKPRQRSRVCIVKLSPTKSAL